MQWLKSRLLGLLLSIVLLIFLVPVALADAGSGTFPIIPPSYKSVPYRGVNLSGAEFNCPQPSNGDCSPSQDITNIPSVLDGWYFVYKGTNTVRVPFALEYLVPPDNLTNSPLVDFTAPYATALVKLIEGLTTEQPSGKQLHVILDMHNYMHYNPDNLADDYNGSDPSQINPNIIGWDIIKSHKKCTKSCPPTADQYAEIWGEIATKFVGNANVIFELMNEPQGVTATEALNLENMAIAQIRAAEKTAQVNPHLILLDGSYFTGLHSWTQAPSSPQQGQPNSTVFTRANIKDPADNYAIDVHQYFDPNFSGTYTQPCLTQADFSQAIDFKALQSWAQNQQIRLFLGEFGANYVKANPQDCTADFQTLLNDVQGFASADPGTPKTAGFIGWTAWSGGHAWGDYLMNLSPGGPANPWMEDKSVFANPKYFTQKPLPTLGEPILGLCNQTGNTIKFASAYGPFLATQPGDIPNNECRYILSNKGSDPNPTNPIQYPPPNKGNYAGLTYQSGSWGVGLTNPKGEKSMDYGFPFCNSTPCPVSIEKQNTNCACSQLGSNVPTDAGRCFVLK